MPRTYCVTYEIITPESAENGDVSERGFCDLGSHSRQIPLPPDLCGDAVKAWSAQFDFDVEVTPEDWPDWDPPPPTSSVQWMYPEVHESYACARAMAKILLDAGATETSGSRHSTGDWYTATDADQDWRDGSTTSYSYHLDGWTPDEERLIAALVKSGSYSTPLDDLPNRGR